MPKRRQFGNEGWDWEKIRRAARSVGGRRQFVERVEELSKNREGELGFFPIDNIHDTAWHELIHGAQEAASVFREGKAEELNWVTAARKRRGQLLGRRLQLRRDGAAEDSAGLEEEFKKISKSLYREGRARWRRRQHALAGDLEEAHRRNQPAKAYNVTRQLTAKGMGSKKRSYVQGTTGQPAQQRGVGA